MAGLPNFATYFGRDMMMTALMMRPIWTPEMSEHVIASVLRKLGPGRRGEPRGGAGRPGDPGARRGLRLAGPAKALDRARRSAAGPAGDARELPHDRRRVPAPGARRALSRRLRRAGGAEARLPARHRRRRRPARLELLAQELALVARATRPYAEDPRARNLVSFPKRDSIHWRSASWRDSDAGYAGGRFAMDVNAIWVPQALEGIATILATCRWSGRCRPRLARPDRVRPWPATSATACASPAIETWRGARRHFEVTLGRREIQAAHRRASSPGSPRRSGATGRRSWRRRGEPQDSLAFLALSLDADGKPIPVVNTDPATGLFLWRDRTPSCATSRRSCGRFPWDSSSTASGRWWRTTPTPRRQSGSASGRTRTTAPGSSGDGRSTCFSSACEPDRRRAGDRLIGRPGARRCSRTLAAVHASGLEHNELWSYRIESGRLLPTRYGTSSDIQLWNTTNLAVQFVLSSWAADERRRTQRD